MKISTEIIKTATALIDIQSCADFRVDSDETGWKINALDPSHVSFSKIFIPATAFEGYESWDTFSVDLEKFQKSLNSKGAELDLDMAPGMMTIKGAGLTTKIRLLDPREAGRTPAIVPPAEVVISSSELKKIIKVLDDQMSLTLTLTEEGLSMAGFSEDGTGSQLDIPADDCIALNGVARASYPLGMLRDFAKALPDKVDADILLGDDMPLVISYDLAGAQFTWLVAPWIDQDV